MRRALLALLLLLAAAAPAAAQIDLNGSWGALFHEDQPERVPGPSLGDYVGLPINDQARAFAEAWDASRLTIPEHQCRAHSSPRTAGRSRCCATPKGRSATTTS